MANFNIPYATEREGQMEFFDNYGIPYDDDASILVDNTDGIYNGCIFEFKLNISNLNKTLFQAVKYLSKMRIKGESVPATILLIDLNATTVYVFRSQDYFDSIHKVYTGAASKDNDSFMAGPFIGKYDYSDMLQSSQVKKILKGKKVDPYEMYMPVDIDENCVVGWAERYYSEKPKATKGDFLGDETGTAVKVTGEIREPKHFKGLIRPYTGETNERFKYLMDCLNDRLSKKDLGAFYTPLPYAKKAAELVQMAVDRVPEGNDYIILDRCAGTGNLESALIGLYDRNGDELIEHCVVSTYEYYEYKVLQERLGDKVRDIIPPTEANVVYDGGKVANADAMSKDFIENPITKQYIDNQHCTIILFENPPYSDSSAITYIEDNNKSKKAKTDKTGKYIVESFKEMALPNLREKLGAVRESSNLFIWSGFEYYIRQDFDAYIVFSPVKYFKNVGLVHKRFVKGFAFNRKHFHATESVISCCLWTAEDCDVDEISIEAIDIIDNKLVSTNRILNIKAVLRGISYLNDKRRFPDDEASTVICNADGTEIIGKARRESIYNKNIIGYLASNGFGPDAIKRFLMRCGYKVGVEQSFGFYLRNDNYIQKLPMWVAKLFPQDNWYDKDIYNTTSDGGDAYTKDPNFLKSCLIYTCLSNQNKCLTFDGSDGRHYQNELCFDGLNKVGDVIPNDSATLALKDLRRYAMDPKTELDDDEKELMELWFKILREAQQTANYNSDFTYGVYQISKELDTYREEGSGRKKTRVYDYPALHGDLDTLRAKLKEYYKSHITEKMFEYELLK